MPTYDYRCKACGHTMDLFQSMSERPKRKCPACGKNQLERLIGMGSALIFKGQGFWQTDYRSESYTQGEKAAKEAETQAKGEASAPKKEAKKKAASKGKAKASPKKKGKD